DEGNAHWEVMTKLLADIGADGLYGDTYDSLPPAWQREAERLSHPLAFEPQNALLDAALAWNLMTWGEEWSTSFVPTVSHHKWLETRHMVHLVRRHARDRTEELQHAFFNGAGYVAWENVWGNWNGITPRDAEALRRIAAIERSFAPLLVSRDWEPYAATLQHGVFASRFTRERVTLWTFVQRNEHQTNGGQLSVRFEPGTKYFDVWRGTELAPERSGDRVTLSFALEPHGFGAVLAAPPADALPSGLAEHLDRMRSLGDAPLESFSNVWKPPVQTLVEIAETPRPRTPPEGMILIPGGELDFRVSGVAIEDDDRIGVDVQLPGEDSPRLHHRGRISVAPFYIDRHPVSNAEFERFLNQSGYRPIDDHNFLRHWSKETYPEGSARKPVTWVSLEDARAYALWAGKRLPHEWEWQYAAQGGDGRVYPWGNEWDAAAVPVPERGRDARPPDDVDSHPRGASPFGVMDLVGNVWQWTDEYRDEHTRAAVLRGGSSFQPQGSFWYFPQAYRLDRHAKYLLMSPSRDRSGSIGFRCVMDAQ
ncbi:MAG TPA: SUMF1/EgtB/PvdO family nonheme iron enzyme, partial [Vicinamibacteria bacterium]